MISKLLLAAGFLLGSGAVYAADGIYPVSKIAPGLKEKAHAVVRMHQTTYTVKNLGEATIHVRYAVTLLDEQAKNQAYLTVFYDTSLDKVSTIQGTMYDEWGQVVEKIKKSDVQDISAISNISLFESSRVKIAQFKHLRYPCTVEFEYESTANNTLSYPVWSPQEAEHVSIENAAFKVIMPAGMELRYKEQNLPQTKATTQITSGSKTYSWELKALPALVKEPYSPLFSEITPTVYTAPAEFQFGGTRGSMRTWEDFGKWDYELNANRDILPEEAKQKVITLTTDAKDPIDKVRKVYDYLQSHTRYISIQLGIGGLQTFEARTVAEKGYGDCKALSNYTMAMLKAVGIPSYCTAIMAGDDRPPTPADFPSMHFNHVILCVPLQKDTIWLECTDQSKAFGYMGEFTGDRYALLATPAGGKLVRTPSYKASDNLQQRRVKVTLDANCDGTVEATTLYTGLQQDRISYIVSSYSPEDQKKWLYKQVNIPSFEINKFSFTQQKSRMPAVTEKLTLHVRKCASKSGTRVFLTPNLMSAWSQTPPPVENRRTDVVWEMDFIDTDTVTYHLPQGFGIEFVPEKVEFSSRFGTYSASVTATNDLITYTRRVSMNKGKFPASAYPELVDFYRKMVKADKMQVVFVNKGL